MALTKQLRNLLIEGVKELQEDCDDRVVNALKQNRKRDLTLELEELGDKSCGDYHRDEIDGRRRCDCPILSNKQWHLCLNFGDYLDAPVILLWEKDKNKLLPLMREIKDNYKEVRNLVYRIATEDLKKKQCKHCGNIK